MIVPSNLATGSGSGTSFDTASVTAPGAGIVLLTVSNNLGGGAATVTGVSGLGGVWAQVGTITSNSGNRRTSLWVGRGCSGTGVITVTMSAGANVIRYAVDSGDTAVGFNAVNARTGTTNGATSLAVSAPASLAKPENVYYVALNHNAAEGVTPTAPGVEVVDTNAGNAQGIETNYQTGTATTPGGSWTTSTGATAVGVELVAPDPFDRAGVPV